MKPVSLILLWIFHAFLKGSSALFLEDVSDTLDAGSALKLFEDCFVQIVKLGVTYTFPNNGSRQKFNSYDLEPLNFPVEFYQVEKTIAMDSDEGRGESDDMLVEWFEMYQAYSTKTDSKVYKVRRGCVARVYLHLQSCDIHLSNTSFLTYQVCRVSCKMMRFDIPPFGISHDIHGYFHQGNVMYRDGLFLIHIGRYAVETLSELCIHKTEIFLQPAFQYHPIGIAFYPNSKTHAVNNTLTNASIFMCPNAKQYLAMAKRHCSKLLGSWFLEIFYENCASQFWRYLAVEAEFNIGKFKTWQDIAGFAYAPCETAHIFYAKSRLDLGRRGKNNMHEYLLDWTDEMGTLVYLYLRLWLKNMTNLNQDDEGNFQEASQDIFLITRTNINSITVMELRFHGPTDNIFFSNQFFDQVHFVMCSQKIEIGRLSFAGFVSVFKFDVWLTLVLLLFGGCGVIHLNGILFPLPNLQQMRPLQVYNILLAQGASHLRENRWFYGAWVIGGLILTNHYLGDNINDLTAPLPAAKWDTFGKILENKLKITSSRYLDIVSHKMFQMHEQALSYIGSIQELHNLFNPVTFETITKTMKGAIHPADKHTVFSFFYKLYNYNSSEEALQEQLNKIMIDPINFSDNVEKHNFFYRILSNCSNEAYVDIQSEILKFKKLLVKGIRNKSIDADESAVVTSKTKYGQVYLNLLTIGLRVSPELVLRKFQQLAQSGIDTLWQNWKIRIESWNETVEFESKNKKDSFQPAKLNGNIRVVFLLHLSLLGCAALVIVFELWKKFKITIKLKLLRVLKSIQSSSKKTRRNVFERWNNCQGKMKCRQRNGKRNRIRFITVMHPANL